MKSQDRNPGPDCLICAELTRQRRVQETVELGDECSHQSAYCPDEGEHPCRYTYLELVQSLPG
jgi:hypothetical protein